MDSQVIQIVLSFITGAAFGYAGRYLIERIVKGVPLNEDAFRVILSFVLVSVFAIAFFVSVIDRSYEIPIAIYPLIGAVVGYYFGSKYLDARFHHSSDNKKNNDTSNEKKSR